MTNILFYFVLFYFIFKQDDEEEEEEEEEEVSLYNSYSKVKFDEINSYFLCFHHEPWLLIGGPLRDKKHPNSQQYYWQKNIPGREMIEKCSMCFQIIVLSMSSFDMYFNKAFAKPFDDCQNTLNKLMLLILSFTITNIK